MENDLRNQPGAVSALESNFVPVKIDTQYYPNTAKQYGVTRLPTTVILAPSPQGEVLAVIPECMPVDQYFLKLNKVVADAKRRETGVFAQIQPSPPIAGPVPLANPVATIQSAITPRPPVGPIQNPTPPVILPVPSVAGPTRPVVASPPANAAALNPMVAMTTGPGMSGSRPTDSQKLAENIKPSANPPFGLDGFCPVQLVENSRWQAGKKAWGAIHRGRTYLFAGVEERRRFLAAPDRYAPVSSGGDVVLFLEEGRSEPGYREHGLQFDGHVYLFADESTLDKFRSNPRYYADHALQALRPAAQTAAMR